MTVQNGSCIHCDRDVMGYNADDGDDDGDDGDGNDNNDGDDDNDQDDNHDATYSTTLLPHLSVPLQVLTNIALPP